METFHTATTGGTPFDDWLLKKAVKLRKRLFRKRHSGTPDAIDNIGRLYDLMQEGAITEEEFEELKRLLKKKI